MSERLMTASLRFASRVERIDAADDLIAELHRVAQHVPNLNLLGAWCVPSWARRDDRRAYTIWAHSSFPAVFWPEFWELYAKYGRSFLADRAWRNRDAFTMTEALRIRKPTGNARWVQELFNRHGVRDVFYCPNGSCMVVYWSPKLLWLNIPTRAALELAAGAAAGRLRALARHRLEEDPKPGLSTRQQAVLRLVAQGYTLHQVGEHLGIGYKTVQEHAERAREKLGAKTLPHAVAEALRRYVVISYVASAACAGIFDVYDIHCWDLPGLAI